ncbi:hypothetical protein AU210_003933 [Fusarium oxysporum f. sp. radicis-cucumerinum]|uniref:C2H2-type domain-containing protein n=7 Tax=Fusarium oxysporum TaxID=5507 RepID=A0A2H3HL05_FUSOX|nr:hypothetical protein AU210_003933 [Fusarium oxysporum f. sp. radicis-cucumerinum]
MEISSDENGYESLDDTQLENDNGERANDSVHPDSAPRYTVPSRAIGAVEIPAVVENIDRTIKAFGRVPNLQHVMDAGRNSIPLYLTPEMPFCKPIMSHNARSHNVVLKITVPKRTGRKRKRGTDGPWEGDVEINDAEDQPQENDRVSSHARLDDPKVLRRTMADNVDKYQVEAVGVIRNTHRFRGLADFYWDMSKSSFAQQYVDKVLPGDVDKIKEFKFQPGTDKGPNVDILPPPMFTHMSLPFNYQYSQNPYVRATEDGGTVNTTAVKQVGYFIGAEDPAPAGPQLEPDMTDPRMVEIMAELEAAFEERPVWTRRSLLNHLGGKLKNWNELKKYLNYAAYQFKGGPWRDGVVPYGIDPRTDPKYRTYQTLMFKLPKQKRAQRGQTWKSLRKVQMGPLKEFLEELSESHVFDGDTFHTDGKVWQVCDITDPLLKELLENAAIRPEWDPSSGWYHGGLWAKVKAIMKTKLVAIQFDRHLTREDFAMTLQAGDETPIRSNQATFHLPLPNLRLTDEELTQLRGRQPTKKNKHKGYSTNTNLLSSPFTLHSKQKMAAVKRQSNGATAIVVSEYKTGSGTLTSDRFWCDPCKRIFSTWQQLHDHKEKMSAQGKAKHIHCQFCSRDFHTESAKITHIQQDHPQEQSLYCTGCGKGPFVRVGGLVSHVEKECLILNTNTIETMREEKMEFSQALTALTKEPLKNNYGGYMPENANKGLPDATWESTGSIPAPFTIEQSQFPSLGESSSTTLQPTKEKKENSWNKGKNLFPDAPAAQRPTQEQLKQVTAPSARATFDLMSDLDPKHPNFNVGRFYSEYTQKFNCRMGRCGKAFKTAKGFIAHLTSEVHSASKYRCPYCLNTFGSLASITQHVESNSNKCKIRDTEQYNSYMDQLLASMVNVKDRHADGTVRYETSKTFGKGPSPGSDLVEQKENPKVNGGDPYTGMQIHW